MRRRNEPDMSNNGLYSIACILIYLYTLYQLMVATTVKVSKETVERLAALQRTLGARSLEETILALIKQHRREILSGAFGIDRGGKISQFREVDRGEDRS